MKLEHEFYKLPLCFDVDVLRKELDNFTDQDWRGHPSDYQGNLAIPLISVNGEINNIFAGPMGETHHLKKTPYMRQVISAFKSVVGRSRLMRLEPESEVPVHSDTNYHWYSRVRIHVPITTTPEVMFYCGDQQVHMAAGDAWIFDSWKIHRVVNPTKHIRIHLVIDTAGSDEFWEICRSAKVVSSAIVNRDIVTTKLVTYHAGINADIKTEKFNIPLVMSPGELEALVDDIVCDARQFQSNDPPQLEQFIKIASQLKHNWREIWSLHGQNRTGWSLYEKLLSATEQKISALNLVCMCNGCNAGHVVYARVLKSAFHPELYPYFNDSVPDPVNRGFISPATVSAASKQQVQRKLDENANSKSGRNAPCPCGSGKKYKKCHGA